jgi:hypothetical protein
MTRATDADREVFGSSFRIRPQHHIEVKQFRRSSLLAAGLKKIYNALFADGRKSESVRAILSWPRVCFVLGVIGLSGNCEVIQHGDEFFRAA